MVTSTHNVSTQILLKVGVHALSRVLIAIEDDLKKKFYKREMTEEEEDAGIPDIAILCAGPLKEYFTHDNGKFALNEEFYEQCRKYQRLILTATIDKNLVCTDFSIEWV